MKKGKLFGIGVGPGDPEQLTLKAVRVIQECDRMILPCKKKENCYAYQIARQAVPEMVKKPCITVDFPMTRDEKILHQLWNETALQLEKLIDCGEKLAFLTIGDPSIYSTYHYIHRRIEESGREAEMIPGVPSFCAAAARLGIALGEREEEICLIPGTNKLERDYANDRAPGSSTRDNQESESCEWKACESEADRRDEIECSKNSCMRRTRVYMKSGKNLAGLKKALLEEDIQRRKNGGCLDVYAVCNCGMPDELRMAGIDQIPDNLPYLTLVIVKESMSP